MTGPRIQPRWDSWDDLPGWLQGATYLAFWIGGPHDECDVERLEAALHMGAGNRELIEREEPRWMVKTLLLLAGSGVCPALKPPQAHQAVAFWMSGDPQFPESTRKIVSAETVRKRCCGDPSTGKKGKWDWASECVDRWVRDNPTLRPGGVAHDYREVMLDRLDSGEAHPLGMTGGAIVRLPSSYWATEKHFMTHTKTQRRFCGYLLRDASAVAGTDVMIRSGLRHGLKGLLGYWPFREVPPLSSAALEWLEPMKEVAWLTFHIPYERLSPFLSSR